MAFQICCFLIIELARLHFKTRGIHMPATGTSSVKNNIKMFKKCNKYATLCQCRPLYQQQICCVALFPFPQVQKKGKFKNNKSQWIFKLYIVRQRHWILPWGWNLLHCFYDWDYLATTLGNMFSDVQNIVSKLLFCNMATQRVQKTRMYFV